MRLREEYLKVKCFFGNGLHSNLSKQLKHCFPLNIPQNKCSKCFEILKFKRILANVVLVEKILSIISLVDSLANHKTIISNRNTVSAITNTGPYKITLLSIYIHILQSNGNKRYVVHFLKIIPHQSVFCQYMFYNAITVYGAILKLKLQHNKLNHTLI